MIEIFVPHILSPRDYILEDRRERSETVEQHEDAQDVFSDEIKTLGLPTKHEGGGRVDGKKKPESVINPPGLTQKKGRVEGAVLPDLTYHNPDTDRSVHLNTADIYADGSPTTRELGNADRLILNTQDGSILIIWGKIWKGAPRDMDALRRVIRFALQETSKPFDPENPPKERIIRMDKVK